MIYLDFAATNPCHSAVWEAMTPFVLTDFGNPASQHEVGQSAKVALEQARTTLLALLGASPKTHQLIFTSGGTEGNNLVLEGVVRQWYQHRNSINPLPRLEKWEQILGMSNAEPQVYTLVHEDSSNANDNEDAPVVEPWKRVAEKVPHFVVAATEHSAVFEVVQWLEKQQCITLTLLYPHPENEGLLTVEQVTQAITPETVLCSIMHANNETGVLQPIESMVKAIKTKNPACLFHCDMVQTVGKLPIDLTAMGVDFATASGHKFQTPKGAGFLVCSLAGFGALAPITYGGSQEMGFRPGTVSVSNAVGLATALTLKQAHLQETQAQLGQLTQWLMGQLKTLFGDACQLNTPLLAEQRLAGIVNASFPAHLGETLVLKLDLRGIAVSSGSACHAGKAVEPSRVLLAMGKAKAIAQSSVRVSMGATTTQAELQALLTALEQIVAVSKK